MLAYTLEKLSQMHNMLGNEMHEYIILSDKIKKSVKEKCFDEKTGIYENYDSVTGKGLCCNHFSWSCTFILEFILNWEKENA